jgi:hypothetical protein
MLLLLLHVVVNLLKVGLDNDQVYDPSRLTLITIMLFFIFNFDLVIPKNGIFYTFNIIGSSTFCLAVSEDIKLKV